MKLAALRWHRVSIGFIFRLHRFEYATRLNSGIVLQLGSLLEVGSWLKDVANSGWCARADQNKCDGLMKVG